MFWFFFEDIPLQEKIRIGDVLYSVHEHLYYDKSIQVAPFLEYIVVKGKVVRFVKGNYTQVVIHAVVDHVLNVYYYKISDLEKALFRKYEDAVQAAIRVTEKYERTWGWCEGKLRRPWENRDESEMTYFPDSKRCAEEYGEGPDAVERMEKSDNE